MKRWILWILLVLMALLLWADVQFSGFIGISSEPRPKIANEFNQVQTAVLGYYTEYSEYPAAPDNATLIKMLTQNNPSSRACRGIRHTLSRNWRLTQ